MHSAQNLGQVHGENYEQDSTDDSQGHHPDGCVVLDTVDEHRVSIKTLFQDGQGNTPQRRGDESDEHGKVDNAERKL